MNETSAGIILTPGLTDAGSRADIFLTNRLNNYSRSAAQRLLKNGCVLANDKIIKPNYIMRGDETVRVYLPAPVPAAAAAEDLPLCVVYEDADIIVVNKPQGMVTHPAAGNYSGTLVNALMHHCGDSLSGINGELRPGIVHRIDKDTSGLIVAAKNDMAHRSLSAQLQARSMSRTYNALVCGRIIPDAGVVDKPVGRHPRDRKKMAINVSNGRPAVTYFNVLERFTKHTLIEARLHTGRTHQIRVHMASVGHPVYGDRAYGNAPFPENIKGQLLHAARLNFFHPKTGEPASFSAPLPDYFIETLEGLR